MKAKTIHLRVDDETKQKLDGLKVDQSKFIRALIEKALKKNKCPTCQHELKSKH